MLRHRVAGNRSHVAARPRVQLVVGRDRALAHERVGDRRARRARQSRSGRRWPRTRSLRRRRGSPDARRARARTPRARRLPGRRGCGRAGAGGGGSAALYSPISACRSWGISNRTGPRRPSSIALNAWVSMRRELIQAAGLPPPLDDRLDHPREVVAVGAVDLLENPVSLHVGVDGAGDQQQRHRVGKCRGDAR